MLGFLGLYECLRFNDCDIPYFGICILLGMRPEIVTCDVRTSRKCPGSRVGIRSGRPTFPRPNRPGFPGVGRSRTWGSRFQPRSRSISV